ncbi:MAG TPA: choice-of-anchor G family protein [Pseudolysinimonas sp.]|jgi:hypothetical protein
MISRARFRRRIATGVALLATAAVVATGTTTSLASWTDTEYVNGPVQSMLCTDAGSGASTGSARLIGGQLGALNVDAIASIAGETVSNPGTGSTATPSGSTSLGGDAYANPLTVSALSTINANLGGAMVLPADVDASALNQWARAGSDTTSGGAAGAVLNSGAISLSTPANGAALPRFATLELGTVLQAVLGSSVSSLVTNLTDIDLGIGAVASDATLDACHARWNGIYTALVRQYALAGFEAVLTSPTVSALATDTNGTLSSLSSAITTIAGSAGLANSLSSGILGTLGTVLSAVGVGTPTVSVSITPDFSAVTTLLGTAISDPGGLASIRPAAGTVTLDLDALLGPAYLSSPQINGLAPNSRLLVNSTAVDALKTALTTAIGSWVSSVIAAVNAALSVVTVHVRVTAPLSALSVGIGTLVVDTTASLASLLAGTAVIDVHVDQTSGVCTIIIVGPTLCGILNGLTSGLTGAVKTALGPVIGGVIRTALAGLSTTVTALSTTLGADSSGLVTFLGTSTGTLFGSSGLVSLTANAQNLPDPSIPNEGTPPSWAATLPGATANPYGTGRFDVAALRLVVAGALPTVALGLDLARSSVGSNTAVG